MKRVSEYQDLSVKRFVMKKVTKIRKAVFLIIFLTVMLVGFAAFFIYHLHDISVSEDYSTIEYDGNTYSQIAQSVFPEDCEIDTRVTVYQKGRAFYEQSLTPPMCYISKDREYIMLRTEDNDDTFPSRELYYKLDGSE